MLELSDLTEREIEFLECVRIETKKRGLYRDLFEGLIEYGEVIRYKNEVNFNIYSSEDKINIILENNKGYCNSSRWNLKFGYEDGKWLLK